jgi:hypothetical protein
MLYKSDYYSSSYLPLISNTNMNLPTTSAKSVDQDDNQPVQVIKYFTITIPAVVNPVDPYNPPPQLGGNTLPKQPQDSSPPLPVPTATPLLPQPLTVPPTTGPIGY